MKTEKELLENARRFKIATAKAISTMLREAPGLVKFFDWRGFDFRDLDLRDCDFSGAFLVGSVFHGANLENAQFQDADFEGAEFSIPVVIGIHARDLEKELDELREAREMDTQTIASLRAEIAAFEKTDELDAALASGLQSKIIEGLEKTIASFQEDRAINWQTIKNLREEIQKLTVDATRRGLLSDLGAFVEVQAQSMTEARDKKEDELDGLRKAHEMDTQTIASLRAEIAELKETGQRCRISAANQSERLGRELAAANREIRRLGEVVDELSHRDRIQIDTIAGLEKNLKYADATIFDLREQKAALDPKAVAAPGSVRVEIARSSDHASGSTVQVVGRLFDSAGDHYSPGFGVKAVVVGRSGSEVLREMSENWSRAGFME